MKKYFFLAAAAPMLLSACSDDDSINEGPVPLTLSVTNTVGIPEISTRSNDNNIQATTLDPSSTAVTGLFILKKQGKAVTSPKESYEQWNIASSGYAANTTITTNTNISTSSTLYYPSDKNQNLDIYAYTPRDASYAGTDISATAVTVTIKDDQSTKANYLLSDVLWGCVGDGTNWDTSLSTPASKETAAGNKSNSPINSVKHKASKTTATDGYVQGTQEVIIPMFHKATKIIIQITPSGMDLADLKGATVKFYVNGSSTTAPILSTSLDVFTGSITALTPAATPIIAPIKFTGTLGKNEAGSDLTNADADATGSKGVIGVANTSMSGYACSGIILPQTVTAGNKLIEITLANNTTYEYVIPTTGSPVTEFESGKVYTYSINLTASTLLLTTTVANWEDATSGTPISGSAVLQ